MRMDRIEDPPSLLHDIRRRKVLSKRNARWAKYGSVNRVTPSRKIRRFTTIYAGRSDVFRSRGW